MRLKLPRHVHGYTDRHGKPRYYLRRPGFKRVPLPGLPWSPQFMAAYEAATGDGESVKLAVGARRTKPGSVNAVIVSYYNSDPFRALASGTQKMRRAILENFRAEHGERRIATLNHDHLVGNRQKNIRGILENKRPFAKRNWLKTLHGLLKFAAENGFREDDPTVGIKLVSPKSDGIHTWTEAEIEQYEAHHAVGSKPRLALGLLVYSAQRRGDVVRMGRQHLHNGALQVKQEKTGAVLEIPVHAQLSALIEATPSEHLTFLTTEQGKPFTPAGFGNWFREQCDKADLPKHCSAHGLRKAACRRLAEAGCTEKQISAISGHVSLSEVQRYTKAADQKRLARDAMRTLQGESEQTSANRKSG